MAKKYLGLGERSGKKTYAKKTDRPKGRKKSAPKSGAQPKRWFKAGEPTGWKKDLPQQDRIDLILASRDYDYLASARALNALANVTRDPETARKARADAKKLFAEHNKRTKAIEKSVKKGKKNHRIVIEGL